jgi:hypothetical protein
MCGYHMEGSHQKGSNWYRCQYLYRRGAAAAAAADHPKVHGIKEEKLLDPILDFLSRRVFGPDRLRLLRDELAASTASTWEEHSAEVERLEAELDKLNRSLRAQTLRLEEHEDPAHPIVALATERIVELSTRKGAVTDALEALNETRPAGRHPDEILSMLDAVPDLRQTLKTAAHDELAEIFRAFDVRITYDKSRQVLDFAVTITPELLPALPNESDRPKERSQDNGVAGAGCVRISPTLPTTSVAASTRSRKCASCHEHGDFRPICAAKAAPVMSGCPGWRPRVRPKEHLAV